MRLPCFLCGGVGVVVFSIWFSYGVIAVLFSNCVTFSHVPETCSRDVSQNAGQELSSRNVSNTHV